MVESKLFLFIFMVFLATCSRAQDTTTQKTAEARHKPSAQAEVTQLTRGNSVSIQHNRTTRRDSREVAIASDSIPAGMLVAGIVRWDSIVAPFGAFDGTRWRSPMQHWFENQSPELMWYITSRSGTRWQVQGGRMVTDFRCTPMYEQWGQQIDFPPDTADWTEFFDSEEDRDWADITCPVARIGFALSDTLTLISMKASEEREKEAILEHIRPIFEEMEADEVKRLNRDTTGVSRIWTGHPVSAAERSQLQIELEVVEHADAPAERVRLYRFVAKRHYAPTVQHDYSCPTRTSLEGFVIEAGNHLEVINPNLGFVGGCSDSPGMGGLTIEPFGLLNLGEKSYLLGLEWGWELSSPVIYEVSSTGLSEVLHGWGDA